MNRIWKAFEAMNKELEADPENYVFYSTATNVSANTHADSLLLNWNLRNILPIRLFGKTMGTVPRLRVSNAPMDITSDIRLDAVVKGCTWPLWMVALSQYSTGAVKNI